MSDRYLSAYYFMGQNLCSVREDTARDMKWLADHQFDAICVGVHEFQLLGNHTHGLRLVSDAAHDAGLDVLAIPSRWCGLIAGWPPTPGFFASTRPDTWMINADGSPETRPYSGPVCSVHHPDVVERMVHLTIETLTQFEVDGLVWDEMKTMWNEFRNEALVDHNPKAIERFGKPAAGDVQRQATFDVFAECNRAARSQKPDVRIVGFVYAYLEDEIVVPWSRIEGFDEIGPDGRPWYTDDFPGSHAKTILSNAERFVTHARSAGKRSFALIETQLMKAEGGGMAVKRIDEVCAAGFDHLSVYYHPLVSEAEAEVTDELAEALGAWRTG